MTVPECMSTLFTHEIIVYIVTVCWSDGNTASNGDRHVKTPSELSCCKYYNWFMAYTQICFD